VPSGHLRRLEFGSGTEHLFFRRGRCLVERGRPEGRPGVSGKRLKGRLENATVRQQPLLPSSLPFVGGGKPAVVAEIGDEPIRRVVRVSKMESGTPEGVQSFQDGWRVSQCVSEGKPQRMIGSTGGIGPRIAEEVDRGH